MTVSNQTKTDIQTAETVASTVGAVASAVGGEAGVIANDAIQGAEVVANSVVADQTAGHTVVQTAADAAQNLITAAPTLAANLPPATAQKVTAAAQHATGFLAMLEELGAELKGLFGL